MILVTGATGMVGAHLLVKLLEQNQQIRAIYRSEEKIEALRKSILFDDKQEQFNRIDWIQADIREVPALEKAFECVTEVYHCAGLISFTPKEYRALRTINIEGTANVVNFAIANKVDRLFFISSIAALGPANKEGFVDEKCYWNQEEDHSIYAITKYGAEMEVWRASQEGIPVIVVNPGVIFGTGVYSKSMEVFERVKKGLRYYTCGGSGFVSVTDVIDALFFLKQKEAYNERFVLVSENMSYKDMLTDVASALGKTPPNKEIGKNILNIVRVLDVIKGVFTLGNRQFTKLTVTSLDEKSNYSSSKIKALGFTFKPMKEAIKSCAI
ncbi:NAD-dependent epimerase [Neptunitalea chrysea]|uniref:NAD-dependent epimerase n=1 Tax=Neptunitalea chrysea TaxID=1647581 RepID=A0A9W6B507_9FLAO|nr:NAD-dependent epimerase/dehydratase family protein [Neptunitalea chrysea]GLB51404.1 NAD-dependent epimerase [Neptunitalea chrysea]